MLSHFALGSRPLFHVRFLEAAQRACFYIHRANAVKAARLVVFANTVGKA